MKSLKDVIIFIIICGGVCLYALIILSSRCAGLIQTQEKCKENCKLKRVVLCTEEIHPTENREVVVTVCRDESPNNYKLIVSP